MSRRCLANKRARGLSLVELLVAITLGAIILGGAVTLFVNNRDTYKTTNELSRLQETARYALDMMVKDIRMAGFYGCADRLDTVSGDFAVAPAPGDLWNPVNPIEGWEGDTAGNYLPSNDPFVAGTRAYGSVVDNIADGPNGADGQVLARGGLTPDSITLRYLAGDMSNIYGAPAAPDFRVTSDALGVAVFNVDAAIGLADNQIVGISDCGGSNVFRIAPGSRTTIPATATVPEITTGLAAASDLSRGYNAAANPMLAPYVGVRYYIGANANSPDPVNDPYPSLYRAVIGTDGVSETTQELFEGVESMQILYGVDEDADGAPNRYVRAGDAPLDVAANWANVVSVRLAIIVRTVDQVGRATDLDTGTYAINDHDGSSVARPVFNPTDDRRRRRVFTTTAQVRNL